MQSNVIHGGEAITPTVSFFDVESDHTIAIHGNSSHFQPVKLSWGTQCKYVVTEFGGEVYTQLVQIAPDVPNIVKEIMPSNSVNACAGNVPAHKPKSTAKPAAKPAAKPKPAAAAAATAPPNPGAGEEYYSDNNMKKAIAASLANVRRRPQPAAKPKPVAAATPSGPRRNTRKKKPNDSNIAEAIRRSLANVGVFKDPFSSNSNSE